MTLPRARSTMLSPVAGRGVLRPYSQSFTAPGATPHSFAAKSIASFTFSGANERMYDGRSMAMPNFRRTAEICQGEPHSSLRRFGDYYKNQWVSLSPMDYKKEIGARIRAAREAKGLKLREVAARVNDLLDLKRINAYENGVRMPGPQEAVILSKVLGVRPAYLMGLEDETEEKLVRNWRTLSERDRMSIFRKVEALALTSRDPIADAEVERHLPRPPAEAPKRLKRTS